jgi:hypothetical protein
MKAQLWLAVVLAGTMLAAQAQPLVVHEWGTFTSLQDEAGRTLGGINTDDEPVPPFCHDLDPILILPPGELSPVLSKGIGSCRPEVTLRLETPVLYFHLPKDSAGPLTATVKVAFRGGWLTQFYPAAETGGYASQDRLTEDTTGTLIWNDLKIGGQGTGPETTNRVWTAPRAVGAASVTSANGESEKFLFYRGVGHLLCPLQVSRTEDSKRLEGRAQCGSGLPDGSAMSLQRLWLVSIRAGGRCAFRPLAPVTIASRQDSGSSAALFSTPAEFASGDYSTANLARLRREMRGALEAEGLFADEAEALLNTWEVSYFRSPGLRLFFLVPQAWTEAYLPLQLSVRSEIKRAMIGRLELVTPEQRALLRQLAQARPPTKPWAQLAIKDGRAVIEGTMPTAYRDLGRFRNALLLDEFNTRPNRSLEAFIAINRLQAAVATPGVLQ